MSDQITHDRSPRAPGLSLQSAIEQARKLHRQIGRAGVKPELAAKALGFSGLTGSGLACIATLSQYGLIDRTKGLVSLSPLSIKLLHPMSPQQFEESVRQAALTPKVFQEIFRDFNQCSPDVLQSHLVQNDFSPQRARRVATVYAANQGFAKLAGGGNVPANSGEDLFGGLADDTQSTSETPTATPVNSSRSVPAQVPLDLAVDLRSGVNPALPRYTVPLSSGEVTLAFSSDALTQEDFEKLKRYLDLFKEDFPSKSDRDRTRVSAADTQVGGSN